MPTMREAADQVLHEVAALRLKASEAQATTICDDAGKMLQAATSLRLQVARLSEYLEAPSDPQALRKLRHDARTPINQLLGYCELVSEEAEEAEDDRWDATLRQIETVVRSLLPDIDSAGPSTDVPTPRGSVQVSHVMPAASVLVGTVLVVDDSRSNREILQRRLARDGLQVETAENGEDALALCRTRAIDVVLLDIMMPVMDGYEALDRIKADPELRHLPVIMLTSLDEPQSISRCIQRGAEDHLPKPFDPLLLRARIGACLEKKRVRDLERDYLAQILAEKKRADDLIHGVIPLGVALSAERDFNRLLDRVLREARHFCGADGGVLSLCKDDGLEHVQLQCESLNLSIHDMRGRAHRIPPRSEGETPLRPAAHAAREDEIVNLPDVHASTGFDLSAVEAFDQRFGYVTKSLVALPLRNAASEVVGALVLWNATGASDGDVAPFDGGMMDVLGSLSLLAGAALESYGRETELRRRIRHLEIRVDEANRRREVSQITETDYFRNLRDMAQRLRASTK